MTSTLRILASSGCRFDDWDELFAIGLLSLHNQLNDFLDSGVSRLAFRHVAPLEHHRYPIRDAHDILQAVGDEDDANPLVAQTADKVSEPHLPL